MLNNFHKLFKFILKLVISFVAISVVLIVLSLIFSLRFTDTFMVGGVISLASGLLTFRGRKSMRLDETYFSTESIPGQSERDNEVDDLRTKLNKIGFLPLTVGNGILLFLTSYILAVKSY